jgi:hypothetical protein
MALPVITDTYRVALNWEHTDGSHATNVIHVRQSSTTPSAVLTHIEAALQANQFQVVSTGGRVTNAQITPLDGSGATLDTATSGSAGWSGGSSGDYIPQVSAIIKETTALRGRSFRGRVFLPWVGEGVQASGALISPFAGNLTTAWEGFVNALLPDMELVIASYKLASAEAVENIRCETETGTQRRRQERNR